MDTFDINKPFCFRRDKDKKSEEREKIIIYCTDAPGDFPIHGRLKKRGCLETWAKNGSYTLGEKSLLDLINFVEPKPATEEIGWSKVAPGTKCLVRGCDQDKWTEANYFGLINGSAYFYFANEAILYRYAHAKLAPSPEPEKEEVIEMWLNIYSNECYAVHASKDEADTSGQHLGRRACVQIKIPFRKGEGISSEELARLK